MTAHVASLLFLIVLAGSHNIYAFGPAATDASAYRDIFSKSNGMSAAYSPMLNVGTDDASVGYKLIGGVAMEKPCCVSWGSGRVDCFIRGEKSNVFHWYKDNGKYQTEWLDLGGVIINNIQCTSKGAGMIDIFVVGQNLAFYTKSYSLNTGKWSVWSSRGGRIMEAASCVARTGAIIECMVRDGKNAAAYISSTNGRWSRWGSRGGVLSHPSKTSRRSAAVVDYWHVGSNSNLWHTYTINGKFGGWENLRSVLRGVVEVVSNEKRIDVFVTSTRNQLMHLVWNGRWQPWSNVGGTIIESPSCVAIGSTIHCFMTGSDSFLYRRSYNGKTWSKWFNSYGSFIDGPACVLSNAKEVSCYMRGFDRSIVEMVYNF